MFSSQVYQGLRALEELVSQVDWNKNAALRKAAALWWCLVFKEMQDAPGYKTQYNNELDLMRNSIAHSKTAAFLEDAEAVEFKQGVLFFIEAARNPALCTGGKVRGFIKTEGDLEFSEQESARYIRKLSEGIFSGQYAQTDPEIKDVLPVVPMAAMLFDAVILANVFYRRERLVDGPDRDIFVGDPIYLTESSKIKTARSLVLHGKITTGLVEFIVDLYQILSKSIFQNAQMIKDKMLEKAAAQDEARKKALRMGPAIEIQEYVDAATILSDVFKNFNRDLDFFKKNEVAFRDKASLFFREIVFEAKKISIDATVLSMSWILFDKEMSDLDLSVLSQLVENIHFSKRPLFFNALLCAAMIDPGVSHKNFAWLLGQMQAMRVPINFQLFNNGNYLSDDAAVSLVFQNSYFKSQWGTLPSNEKEKFILDLRGFFYMQISEEFDGGPDDPYLSGNVFSHILDLHEVVDIFSRTMPIFSNETMLSHFISRTEDDYLSLADLEKHLAHVELLFKNPALDPLQLIAKDSESILVHTIILLADIDGPISKSQMVSFLKFLALVKGVLQRENGSVLICAMLEDACKLSPLCVAASLVKVYSERMSVYGTASVGIQNAYSNAANIGKALFSEVRNLDVRTQRLHRPDAFKLLSFHYNGRSIFDEKWLKEVGVMKLGVDLYKISRSVMEYDQIVHPEFFEVIKELHQYALKARQTQKKKRPIVSLTESILHRIDALMAKYRKKIKKIDAAVLLEERTNNAVQSAHVFTPDFKEEQAGGDTQSIKFSKPPLQENSIERSGTRIKPAFM